MINDIILRQGLHRTPMAPLETVPPACGADLNAVTRPPFIRLPKQGDRCAWTGLSRATLYKLILGPGAPVRSLVINHQGASRGVRLVELDSLLCHLNSLVEKNSTEARAGKEDERHV